jgi:hypothetical protein
VKQVIHYDSEFHRQRQRERMAEIRAEYIRAQAQPRPRAEATKRPSWSPMRWRRSPAFRA